MKKIVCELCEGTEFTKDGGFFICQGCGTRYSLEEAKNMMREVDDAEIAGSATPIITTAATNPNQQQIDNLLVLATTAYEAQNNQEAENYCNRAIELDATNYRAWLLKGKSVGWSSSLQNNRMQEAAHSFSKAIDFAPTDETEEVKTQAIEELKRFGIACMQIACDSFSKYGDSNSHPNRNAIAEIQNARKAFIDSLNVLSAHGNEVSIPEGYIEEITDLMSGAATVGHGKCMMTSGMLGLASVLGRRPSSADMQDCLEMYECCYDLLQETINLSNPDDEKNVERYALLADCAKYVVEEADTYDSKKQEYRVKKAEAERQKAALEIRVKELKAEAERKAEEEKQARIKAYWEAHAEEKASLEKEKETLTAKIAKLRPSISEIEGEINNIDAELKTDVPSEAETKKIDSRLKEIDRRMMNLGLFAGREKKQLNEERSTLYGRRDALKDKIQKEKYDRDTELRGRKKPLEEKKDDLSSQLEAAEKRLAAVESELTKDPE